LYDTVREEILQDPWVSVHYGDPRHPNYLNPDFEAGVDYGEEKMIEKACEWLESTDIDMKYWNSEDGVCKELLIEDFKKAMES
jgi:hypothetical protein